MKLEGPQKTKLQEAQEAFEEYKKVNKGKIDPLIVEQVKREEILYKNGLNLDDEQSWKEAMEDTPEKKILRDIPDEKISEAIKKLKTARLILISDDMENSSFVLPKVFSFDSLVKVASANTLPREIKSVVDTLKMYMKISPDTKCSEIPDLIQKCLTNLIHREARLKNVPQKEEYE